MKRPTNSELTNLLRNLEELARVEPGDKVSVTSDRFSVQRRGFFSQSVARTFSKNSARAYFVPVYRLFQIAVVDRLWHGLPQPWQQIDGAFAGLDRLKQTYVLELEEARRKQKSASTLAEKTAKVAQLDRLLAAVTPLVRSPRNVNPDNVWAAAPRGYGRSGIVRFSNALKQRILGDRRFGANASKVEVEVPFDPKGDFSADRGPAATDTKSRTVESRKVSVSSQFKVDAIDRSMTLLVHGSLPFDHFGAGFEATMAYYLKVLHGDVPMLEEITNWCNQGVLGSVAITVISQGPVPHGEYYNFLTASGVPLCPNPGSPDIRFNLFEIRTRKNVDAAGKLHDEVAEASIHVSIVTNPATFLGTASEYARGPWVDDNADNYGLNCRGPIAWFDVQFDFVILRTGPTSFQYRIINEQMIYETQADVPGRETPAWMINLDAEPR